MRHFVRTEAQILADMARGEIHETCLCFYDTMDYVHA